MCELANVVLKRRYKLLSFHNNLCCFSIWFSICLPIYIRTGALTATLWRHIDFSRWRP